MNTGMLKDTAVILAKINVWRLQHSTYINPSGWNADVYRLLTTGMMKDNSTEGYLSAESSIFWLEGPEPYTDILLQKLSCELCAVNTNSGYYILTTNCNVNNNVKE